MKQQLIINAVIVTILTGCTAAPVSDYSGLKTDSKTYSCLNAYKIIDNIISQEMVNDAEGYRIPGYPYLRSNRFLFSLTNHINLPENADAWLNQLIKLDQQGRQIELNNLSDTARDQLDNRISNLFTDNWLAGDVIEQCPKLLKPLDIATPQRLDNIIKSAKVPENYSSFKRFIGLYPLTRLAVYRGYQQWKKENLASFKLPYTEIPWVGTPVIYHPESQKYSLSTKQIANIIDQSRDVPLNIPEISGENLITLAHQFSPLFLVDQLSKADEIGRPFWTKADQFPDIDSNQPEVYFRLGYTWFEDIILPQLVYTVWFPERPRDDSAFDILSGRLDGIIWRITIGNDGKPLIADTIHPCGCYHLFFPESNFTKRNIKKLRDSINEQIDTPQILPVLLPEERLVIRLAAKTHYVQALGVVTKPEQSWIKKHYKLNIGDPIPDIALRSMQLPTGNYKSLYGTDGLIKGTERGERWLLWTMGINSPGAMRQWGRHATVFVGRRHFDDPYLLDKEFTR